MKPVTWMGILLVIVGVLALAYGGISYTHQESDMNPYKNHTLDELLLTPLNEEVFDRILEILDQKQGT